MIIIRMNKCEMDWRMYMNMYIDIIYEYKYDNS